MSELPRNIKVQLIVRPVDGLSLYKLNEAVCRYLESKGFKTTLPHVYPEDPLIVEITEPIPNFGC